MVHARPTPAPALVLFDIDGTLLRRSGPHHRQALVYAISRVTGLITTTDHIPVHGMLDRDILTWMMQDGGAGKDLIRRAMPEVVRKAQSLYVRRCPDLRSRVCPGARRLLQRLWRRGVVNGLVTGNLTRIGWKKMERAGLRAYLRFGAFSEFGKDRSSLARLALKTARASGWIGPVTPVSLIGDHPNDILAAKANGMRSVAVATGLSTREELMAHAPDLLVDDLRALRLEWLLTNG